MIKLSPSERGASVTTPTCLDREEEPEDEDLGLGLRVEG